MSCNQNKVDAPVGSKEFPNKLAPQHTQVISSYLQSVASEQFGGEHLNPRTADLIGRFAAALAEKLAAAEKKYGYSDGWADPGWMDECRAKLLEHVAKGDPRDVAAYSAFLWHQGESTAGRKAEVEVDASGWRVPLIESSFGTVLDHGIHDTLVLVMHRGPQGWHVGSANAHALLPRQVYVENVEPLRVKAYEIAVVGLNGGGWRTVWAASDSEVTHPIKGGSRTDVGRPVVDDPAGSLRWLDRRIADMGEEDKTAELYQHYVNLRALIRMGRAPTGLDSVVLAARNAELAIRNCVTAGQVGAGYAHYADDLRDAVRRLVQQPAVFDFAAHLQRQREWSERTFGPGPRTAGVIDHIRKELCEIEAAPHDGEEWIDAVILALDGAWRSGLTPQQIIETMVGKQAKNEGRSWPDWRTAAPDKAIEHDRAADQQPASEDPTLGDAVEVALRALRAEGYGAVAYDLEVALSLAEQPATVTQPGEPDLSNGSGDGGDKIDWVMVPRVPTEAMRTARRMYGDTSDWWTAAIAAAPEPPSARVGVEEQARAMFEAQADEHSVPWERQWEATRGFWRNRARVALAQQPAAVATDGSKTEAQRGPVGTVTRRDSCGDAEVLEHRVELDPAFDESLNALPAGTVVKLYAYPQADAALTQVRTAAVGLAESPAADADKTLLDAIASNYWGLVPFDMPTPGGDDADVGWRVIEYHRAAPLERVVAEHFHDDPRQALAAAIDQGHG